MANPKVSLESFWREIYNGTHIVGHHFRIWLELQEVLRKIGKKNDHLLSSLVSLIIPLYHFHYLYLELTQISLMHAPPLRISRHFSQVLRTKALIFTSAFPYLNSESVENMLGYNRLKIGLNCSIFFPFMMIAEFIAAIFDAHMVNHAPIY